MKRSHPSRSRSRGGGPLVTDHLENVMELETLKRRFTIEQQQQMLKNSTHDVQPFQRSQPQYDQPQNYGQSHNFSHDGRQGLKVWDSQFGQNNQSVGSSNNDDGRQGLNVWDSQFGQNNQSVGSSNNNTPAMSNTLFNFSHLYDDGRQGLNVWDSQFGQNNQSVGSSNNNTPAMSNLSNIAQLFNPQYVPPPNKPSGTSPVQNVKIIDPDFVKADKKYSYHASNNLKQQPLPSRNAWGAQAIPLAKTKPDPSKESLGILRANVKPSAAMIGRMELAMGTLLQEIRERISITYPTLFCSEKSRKEIKKNIRLRIREVLLDKNVPQLSEILQLYRAKFPEKTDNSLIQFWLKKRKKNQKKQQKKQKPKKVSMKFLPEEQPDKFFKFQFDRLFLSCVDKLLDQFTEIQKQENKRSGKKEKSAEQSKNVEPIQEDIATNASANKSIDETGVQEIITIESESDSETLAEETEIQEIVTIDSESDSENGAANGNHSKREAIETRESIGKKNLNPKRKIRFYRHLMQLLIEKRLPHIVSKRKDYLIKNLDIDTLYRTSRAGILMAANKMAESLNDLPLCISLDSDSDNEEQKVSDTKTPPTETTPAVNNIMYYVKVEGMPALPDKNIMKEFIYTYNPKTVKKHKQINNLLFIGFASKADQEMILSANGTTVGNKKLVITKSNKLHRGNGAPKDNDEPRNGSVDLDNGTASIKEEPQWK